MSTTFNIGDLVIVAPLHQRPADRGVVYRVTKIMKVNILVEPVGGGRALRARPELFEPAPATAAEPGSGAPTAEVTFFPVLPTLWQGTVVTIAGPGWRQPADDLFVVLRDKVDKVSVTRLGGVDGARYYPSVPRSYVTAIDPTRLTYTAP